MLTIILLSINILVCVLLIGTVLIQKSEGGALGMGGGPSNFMSARGTGDLLTRITWILFSIFLVISITLTLMSAAARKPSIGRDLKIDPSQVLRPTAPAPSGGADAAPPNLTIPGPGEAPATNSGLAPSIPAPAPATPAEKK